MQAEKDEKHWQLAVPVRQLEQKGRIVAKVANKQIALFKTDAGIFAINNRCPHEGYPLLNGTLNDSCTLACNWHGWTFNLETGQAIQGRDAVKTYATKVEGGGVFIHLKPDCPEETKQAAISEIGIAIAEHDYDRIARSLCRFTKAGGSYETIAAETVNWSLDRLERGFGHGHAGLSDWISLAGSDDDLRLIAFLEAIGHFSWDGIFSPAAPVPAGAVPWDENTFLEAIDKMDQRHAMSICMGAFEADLDFSKLKPLFQRHIFAHYAGFGHPAIYLMKAECLISQLGASIEKTLCLQLTRYLCLAAREDQIPKFKVFRGLMNKPQKSLGPKLPFASELVHLTTRQLLPLVDTSSDSNIMKWESLLAAAAVSMLMFDESLQHSIEQPIAKNVGWLDFTHAITFAEAAHFHASESPSLWRSSLLQLACFVGRNSQFLSSSTFEQYSVRNAKKFLAQQKAALFDMDAGEYIFGVHRLKLVVATESLLNIVSKNTAELLLAALNKFLSSRVRQRYPARTAFQARSTVLLE